MRTYKILLILSIFAIPNFTLAQKTWTLEECIGYALQNNIQIKRQGLQTEIANNTLQQSKFDLAPDLYGGLSHTLGHGNLYTNNYTATSNGNFGNFGLQSSITIFNGFQKINTIKANKYGFLVSMNDLDKIKNDISLIIASGYLQILYTKELRDVSQSQLDITKMQVEKTKKLYEVGNLAYGSLLQIEAQGFADEASLTEAENNFSLSKLTLAQMLDLDTINNFSIYFPEEIVVPETFNDNPDSIYRIALENMPQIKSAQNNLLKAQSQLAITNGSRIPQLSATGSYGTRYDFNGKNYIADPTPTNPANYYTINYPIRNQLNDNLTEQVTINLTIPIFTKRLIYKNVSNAKIIVKDAEYALRQSQIQLRKDIEQAYFDALASFKKYKSNVESVKASEESFKYTQQKFDVGLVNSVDYNVEKNNLIKAKSDFLQSKYEFIFKTKILEFYKGNAIKL